MTLLNAHDWVLMREKPCRFDAGRAVEDWCGATAADGSQYWINGKFTENLVIGRNMIDAGGLVVYNEVIGRDGKGQGLKSTD